MASYEELKAQAEALIKQAEEVRKAERAEKIKAILGMMAEYDISIEDLGGRLLRRRAGKAKPIKFRGPNGETWSGGPGRRPAWVRKILAEGGDLEQYRVA